jgi:hypothetical protein
MWTVWVIGLRGPITTIFYWIQIYFKLVVTNFF